MKHLFFLVFFSFSSWATNTWDLTDPSNLAISNIYPDYELLSSANFAATGNGKSIIGFKTKKSNEDWEPIFIVSIGHSKNGNQRIYITTAKTCNDIEVNYEDIILKTNEQNVRYNKFCNGSFQYITPRTDAGDRFLESEFRKEDVVTIEFSDIVLFFDATGFNEAWDSKGGDAL